MAMDPALRAVVNKINKEQPGSVLLGSELNFENIPRITSGSLSLDVILGGGWPANQWNELYGEFSSGKTAVILKTIAANQARDPHWVVWWLAAEHFALDFAQLCGVDTDRVFVHDTNAMEEGLQKVIEVAQTKVVDCIVIDSLPALVPVQEDENAMGDWSVGLSPRIANQFWRKQRPATSRSLTEVERPITGFVVNQFREKIGVMHGDPRTTPGGKGKDFAYFTRVELRRDDWIMDGKEPVGQVIKAVTRKNKSHRPLRTATFAFYFEDCDGIPAGSYDTLQEIVDLSVAFRVVDQSGSWFYYGDDKFQGRNGLASACREDPKLAERLSEDVLALTRPRLQPKKLAPKKARAAKKSA